VASPLTPAADADSLEPESFVFLPLSQYYSRCFVCGEELGPGEGASAWPAGPCLGPDAASQRSTLAGAEGALLPPYVADWQKRHRYGYWQTVREHRLTQVPVGPAADGTPTTDAVDASVGASTATTTTAPAPAAWSGAVPRVVKVFNDIHPARYDYAFLIFTLLLFPYTWSLISLLYWTGWFRFESFFWECCGTLFPRSRGCERIVALENGHVICVRVYESRHLLPETSNPTQL
jgi:hypothetical protein